MEVGVYAVRHELAAREHLAREAGFEDGKNLTIVAGLKSIIKTTKATVEEAMNMLEVPVNDRQKYLAMLENLRKH